MQSDKEFLKELGKRTKKHKKKRFRFPQVLSGNVSSLIKYFNGD